MTSKYDDFIVQVREFTERAEAFEQRGKAALWIVFQEFANYLQMPQGVCWIGPPGVAIDETKRWHPQNFAQLRPDGYFAGSLVVEDRDKQPLGPVIRFTFYVRLQEGDIYTLAYGDREPLKPMTANALSPTALAPFFERVLASVAEHAKSSPERIAMDESPRPIGFTAPF